METYFQRYVASGGVMMYFLIPCSFFAIGFILQGWINLRNSRIVPHSIVSAAQKISSPSDLDTFRQLLRKDTSPLANILERILELNPTPAPLEVGEIADEFIDDEVALLYHKNNQLAVIYTVSPLLGLLGTIIGMMKTFYAFSMSQEHSIAQLSRGINEALVTTLWGLAIAIPSFVVLYLFKQRLFYYETSVLPRTVKEIWNTVTRLESEFGDPGEIKSE